MNGSMNTLQKYHSYKELSVIHDNHEKGQLLTVEKGGKPGLVQLHTHLQKSPDVFRKQMACLRLLQQHIEKHL